MLKLENLAWRLPSGEQIVNDISLTIPDGSLTVITGPNGGGKTSLAKLIAGLVTPTSGRILFNDKDITGCDITERARLGIGYAFQQPVRFKGLTVRDILELANGKSLNDAELCDLLGRVGLCANEYVNRELNNSLSGGEMKRIEIASVLARSASLCVFDEPEAGIDLWSFAKLVETFGLLRGTRTLVIISHQERILRIADEIVVVANGKLQKQGKTADILPELFSGTETACPYGIQEAKLS